jgi:SNF2 family DNA or RNA helicase
MNFLNPGLLGNASFFRHHFELPITKGKNEEKEEKLKKITAPFILRRTKEMVATDLPPISYQTIYCPMAEEQKKLYEKEKSCYRNELWNKETNSSLSAATKFSTLQALTRLRLIANHPVLADQTYSGASGKFDIVIERICNIVSEGHKIRLLSTALTPKKSGEKRTKNRLTKLLAHSHHYPHKTPYKFTQKTRPFLSKFHTQKDCHFYPLNTPKISTKK